MIRNENAKNGIFLASPNELNLTKEADYTNKINLHWLQKLILNESIISFYSSSMWRQVRELVKQRDHNECQRCAYYKRLTVSMRPKDLHVHHIAELEKFPELALNMNNLILVCHQCHNEIHERFQEQQLDVTVYENFDASEWWC